MKLRDLAKPLILLARPTEIEPALPLPTPFNDPLTTAGRVAIWGSIVAVIRAELIQFVQSTHPWRSTVDLPSARTAKRASGSPRVGATSRELCAARTIRKSMVTSRLHMKAGAEDNAWPA
jgi:hypothetical protein